MNDLDKLFYLIYQPIVRIISDGETESYEFEVLLRSKETDRFPANEFNEIVTYDETNRIFLDWYERKLTEKALSFRGIYFSINFHPQQWEHPSTYIFLRNMAPLSNRLVIELTEHLPTNMNMKYYENAFEVMAQHGFLVAVDDVGSGMNSLSFLVNYVDYIYRLKFSLLHFREMKPAVIDSFLHSWNQFAKEYQKELVVEGVESQELSSKLFKQGINLQQGYLFGKGSTLED